MPSANHIAKENFVKEFSGTLSGVQAAVVAHQAGITVEKVTALRAEMRKQKVTVKVVKNTLARKAVEGTPMAELKGSFKGPSVLVYTTHDPVAMAKALMDFANREKDKLVIQAGVLQGKLLSAKEVAALATIPPREVLLARMVGALQSPYAGFVYALSGILRKLVYALEAVRRKKEEQGNQ